jgi:hypothetical protein
MQINITDQQGGFWNLLESINSNKYFVGIIMILLNIGSRYISLELSKIHENVLGSLIVRRLIVFTVVFTATRDIWVSIILTASFIILVSGLFNEKSKYCMIPKKYIYLSDEGGKTKITNEQIENAKKILEYAEKKNPKNKKETFQNIKKKRSERYKINIQRLQKIEQFKNKNLY